MRIRTHALITYGATAVAIGALSMWGVTESPAAVTTDDTAHIVYEDGATMSEPVASQLGKWPGCVDKAWNRVDWYAQSAGVSFDEFNLIRQACVYLGADANPEVWEDGSWRVTNTVTGVFWRGCFETGKCNESNN